MSKHNTLGVGEIHQIFNWIWADETARLAQTVTVDDLYKSGFVESTQVGWTLLDITPTWIDFIGTGGSALNDLSDVTITTPLDDQVLTYSGGVWVNGVGSTGNEHTVEDAVVSAVTDVVTISHNSTGTPIAGFGTGIKFQAESDTTPDQIIGGIQLKYRSVTDATRSSVITFLGMDAGDLHEAGVLTLGGSGVNDIGNARGINSVDLQSDRSNPTEVASGNSSVIVGGNENTVTGTNSAIIGGSTSTVTSSLSFVGTAANASISGGFYCFIGSGYNNSIVGRYNFIGTGIGNTIVAGNHNGILEGLNNIITAGDHGVITSGNGNLLSGTGDYNIIGGGLNNEISISSRNTILNGFNNLIQRGIGNVIVAGNSNVIGNTSGISGGFSTILNGSENTTGDNLSATILAGNSNFANANDSVILNGNFAETKRQGEILSNYGKFANRGDTQATIQLTGFVTTPNTSISWYNFNLDGVPVNNYNIPLDTSSVVTFSILITGLSAGTTEKYGYKIEGVASNSAGTVTIDSSTVTTLFETVAGYNVQVVGVLDELVVQVQDVSGGGVTPLRWGMSCRMVEIVFP